MPNPQPDAREVERAREIAGEWLRFDWGGEKLAGQIARYGAARFAEGVAAERERAARISESFAIHTGRCNLEIADAIRAGATP